MTKKTIAYITDIHLDEQQPKEIGVDARKNWTRIIADIERRQIDEVVFGGDIGEATANKSFFDSLDAFNLKITLGNHDTFSEAIKYYSNEYQSGHPEMYYSYSDNYYKYIFLDSSSTYIGSIQMSWFAEQLNTNKTILLFIHHPILKVDTIVEVLYPLKNRDQIYELLRASQQKTIIFCGHYHTDDETEIDNIRQYTTAAASYQIRKNTLDIEPVTASFGYRLITIENDKITTEVVMFNS